MDHLKQNELQTLGFCCLRLFLAEAKFLSTAQPETQLSRAHDASFSGDKRRTSFCC